MTLSALRATATPSAIRVPGHAAPRPGTIAPILCPVSICMTPASMQAFYDESNLLAAGDTGTGTIGLAELCDPNEASGSYQSDVNNFDSAYSLPAITIHTYATGSTGTCTNTKYPWHQETNLDIQWAHVIAPGAAIDVCFDNSATLWPGNCDNYFVTNAATLGIRFVSNSFTWSGSFDSIWSSAYSAGITMLSATGDSGSGVNWPAAEPNGVAVGGTTITSTVNGGGVMTYNAAESAWSGSGGGCTSSYATPTWQAGMTGFPGICSSGQRGVPDVAMDADPNSGVFIYDNGGWFTNGGLLAATIGGTSLATPMWAGVLSVIAQSTGRAGAWAPILYGAAKTLRYPDFFHDITSGSNGYSATGGWDPVTGVGTPDIGELGSPLVFGTQYIGSATTAVELTTQVTVPYDFAPQGTEYVGLLGAYDSTAAYDMIGVADYSGGWWLFYDQNAGHCASGGTQVWNAYPLNMGTTYPLSMTISSSAGTITYAVDLPGSTTVVWSTSLTTTATYFKVDNSAPCGTGLPGGGLLPGWSTAEYLFPLYALPTENFIFADNQYCSSSTCYNIASSSVSCYYSPYVDWNNYCGVSSATPTTTTVEDELFTIAPPSSQYVTLARGTSATVTGTAAWVNSLCSSSSPPACTVTFHTATALPSGLSISYSPTSGTVNFAYTITITASSSNACTYSNTEIQGVGTPIFPGEVSEIGLVIQVTGCGGGGCVAQGTMIQTPTGPIPVEELRPGSPVLSYDVSTGAIQVRIVTNIIVTAVGSVLDINDGQLLVTLQDQPLWVKGPGFTGIVKDPSNLTLADFLFDPLTGEWVPIHSLAVLNGATLVYDVQDGPHGSFLGGELLAFKKMP
ncbi:MAG TPA: hypothetical protein VN864_00100 [Thermoplasmata archaeon]|nr:hypothetical protein [Thermoplasmata archaeon]